MNAKQYKNAVEKYIAFLPSSGASDQTVRGYGSVCRQYERYIETERAAADSSETITAWRTYLYENGVSINTIRHYLTVLKTFFDWAVENNYCFGCPIKTNLFPKKKEIKYDLLSLDEIKKVLNERPRFQKNSTFLRNRAIVVLAIGTGLRNAEIRSLALSDIDFEKGLITVRNGKGNKSRKVAFPQFVRTALVDYIQSGMRPKSVPGNAPLFGNRSNGNLHEENGEWHEFTSVGICEIIKRYVYQCTGHKNIGTHDLRHAFASVASYVGTPTRDISLVMGHSNELITQSVYISILDNARAAERVNEKMDKVFATY